MTTSPKLSQFDLQQFAGGTRNYYQHGINPGVVFTDGVKHVVDAAGAYWLLDFIVLAQVHLKALRGHRFQVWALSVLPDNRGTITVEDGNKNVLLKQSIDYTEFPECGVTLWYSGSTIYLPVEH